MRLISVWEMATRLPTIMVSAESAQRTGVRSTARDGKGCSKDTQQGGKTGDLGASRHEGRHRCGCALVDIRCPHVEGDRCDLEAEPDQDQGCANGQEQAGASRSKRLRRSRSGRWSRSRQRPARCRRRQIPWRSAQQEVFEPSFFRIRFGTGEGSQHIKRDGEQFERQEDHDQVAAWAISIMPLTLKSSRV